MSTRSTSLIAGAPEIPMPLRERIAQTAPGWALRSDESADTEMKAVADAFDADTVSVLRGGDASESTLRARVPDANAIHLAVPFRINGASPLFSLLLFAGEAPASPQADGSDPLKDGAVEARDVMNLTLRAPVAVLSDGAALSMRDAAEAAPLVQWAWRAAGVPYLLVPRWPTDETAASQLLVEFHRRLRAGDSPGGALSAAQESVRRTDARSAPFYWAGWLLIGGR